jgi:hypothetical protein
MIPEYAQQGQGSLAAAVAGMLSANQVDAPSYYRCNYCCFLLFDGEICMV